MTRAGSGPPAADRRAAKPPAGLNTVSPTHWEGGVIKEGGIMLVDGWGEQGSPGRETGEETARLCDDGFMKPIRTHSIPAAALRLSAVPN